MVQQSFWRGAAARRVRFSVALRALALLALASAIACSSEPTDGAAGDPGTAGAVAVRRAALFLDIHNCTELQAMELDLRGEYRLANDIDCTGFDAGDGGGFRPIGYGGSTASSFRGDFDGDGHVITGLHIDRPDSNWVALFGFARYAEIHNVGLEGVDITGNMRVAALVGVATYTNISQVYATGAVTGYGTTGGLWAAITNNSTIVDSYSSVAVTRSGGSSPRGLVAGSMVGNSVVARTYSSGTVNSGAAFLVQSIEAGSTVTASFFDCTVAGNCSGSRAASTTAMQTQSQYTTAGWDFDTVWGFSATGTYPCLRWQAGCGVTCEETDPTCDGMDEDCDSEVDDDYASQETTCGVGACASTGSTSCVSGAVQDSCAPGTPEGSDSTCDGIDDDCSGAADEDYASTATTCGVGACASTGSTSCVSGAVQDSCAPGTPASDDATCDAIDDDCSGAPDEDYAVVCTGSERVTCVDGAPFNMACDDDNVCNGSESCASGACVPGTPLELPDSDPCTLDVCDPETGVSHPQAGEGHPCADDNDCNGVETCRTLDPLHVLQVNPRETYFSHGDPSTTVLIHSQARSLEALDIAPGDSVTLATQGNYHRVSDNRAENRMMVVFSTSSILYNAGVAPRVPGAIASNAPAYDTGSNYHYPHVPEDFLVYPSGVTVTVPQGATYFFVSRYVDLYFGPWDQFADTDGDFAITLRKQVPDSFACGAGAPASADDGNACTIDSCDPELGFVHDPYPEGATTCTELEAECGTPDDGCGEPLDCGECPPGELCGLIEANRCGPPALSVQPKIHLGRAINAALLHDGAQVVEPASTPSADAAIEQDLGNDAGWTLASSPDAKAISIQLTGSALHVLDRLRFHWTGSANTYQVWTSENATFAVEDFVLVGQGAIVNSTVHDVQLTPTRARYVRLVIDNTATTSAWAGSLDDVQAWTRAREGGVVSLLPSASAVRASSEVGAGGELGPVTAALDFSSATRWRANGSTAWAVIQLAPSARRVDQIELLSSDLWSLANVRDFALDLSNTGSADEDFTQVLTGTLAASGTLHTFSFAPTQARYARIRILSNYGASFSELRQVWIFGPEHGGASVPFADLTALPETQIASRSWSFGDGTTSSLAHPVHVYDAPGIYEVKLTVTDTQGNASRATAIYEVLQAPLLEFTWSPDPMFEGDPVTLTTFTDTAIPTPGHLIYDWHWLAPGGLIRVPGFASMLDVPNERRSGVPGLAARFDQDGHRTVTLTVTDSQLLTTTRTHAIEVLNRPPFVAPIANVTGYWGESLYLGNPTGAVTDQGLADRSLLTCRWDFGDGETQAAQSCANDLPLSAYTTHVYAHAGTYTVTLTVADDVDETSITATATILKHPTSVVPLDLEPTATTGLFVFRAQLFDMLDIPSPMAGHVIDFTVDGTAVSATTNASAIATAQIAIDQPSMETAQYSFAGDADYLPSSDVVTLPGSPP